jgi:hypothetical protein
MVNGVAGGEVRSGIVKNSPFQQHDDGFITLHRLGEPGKGRTAAEQAGAY